MLPVPVRLGVEQLLEFAPVEEDAAAFAALVDDYSTALVLAHLGTAFGTDELHAIDGTG
ncbi:hypothetical protein H1D33_30385 [Micromonospora robiginosa]|uniref:Uncharacterized protein n=1 Tax=Micromonospora robiginosa TaxID=2749844 RepID=A0AAF0P402_9ACTN|nr:hypothetical protein [Micromonospora ferruginea]WMF04612.1 hypothetical protein H1D33_30385 [Micromonospora ferruginea]